MGGFCLVVEFHQEGCATKGNPVQFIMLDIHPTRSPFHESCKLCQVKQVCVCVGGEATFIQQQKRLLESQLLYKYLPNMCTKFPPLAKEHILYQTQRFPFVLRTWLVTLLLPPLKSEMGWLDWRILVKDLSAQLARLLERHFFHFLFSKKVFKKS